MSKHVLRTMNEIKNMFKNPISSSTRRVLLNTYYDTKRFTQTHWPHIIVTLLIIYLLTSLSFTSIETFQNRQEKDTEIILPLKYDKRTERFTTLVTFYENDKKTPVKMHINLGTIFTSVVEKSVTYCVTPHAKFYEIPCDEKCHSIYGAKCSTPKYPLTDTLNINKKLLKVVKRCITGAQKNGTCGTVYDDNHSKWVKIYQTRSKIQLGDKIFHGKVFLDIVSKMFTTENIDRNWNVLGLGYPTKADENSILNQMKIKMLTIIDNPDTNDSKLILNPRLQYFKDPDIRTSFFAEDGQRFHFINSISITPKNPSKSPAYSNTYARSHIGKILISTSSSDLIINHQMKVEILNIFRILGLLTREEDDNAFTHFNKPLILNYKPNLFPIIRFEFKSPNRQTEFITLRPRNYIKQIEPSRNRAITHFIARKGYKKHSVFGMPFFKYRAVTFNDETTAFFIKEIDLHPTHQSGSKLISGNQQSNQQKNKKPTIPNPKNTNYPKKMVRKVKNLPNHTKKSKKIAVNMNYNQKFNSNNNFLQ